MIEQLLDAGAEIEATDAFEHTPLMCAMFRNKPEAATVLVARGAIMMDGLAVDTGAQFGSIAALKALMTSPRWLAMSRTARLEVERLLLRAVRDNSTLDVVRSLVLDMSTLVTHRTGDGGNALHYGAQSGEAVPLICALIKEGVDPSTRNNAGQTPADLARATGHVLQATLLQRAAEDKRRRDLQQQQEGKRDK